MNKLFKVYFVLLAVIFLYSCSNDSSMDDDPSLANKKVTGSSANQFLAENQFNSLLIEVIYVENYKPTQTAINNLVNFIQERTYKSAGIQVVEKAIPLPGKSPYSLNEVRDLEDINREHFNNGNQLALMVLFLDGNSDQDTESSMVLGTAYRNTSFVVFENTVRQASNSPSEPNTTVLESTVMRHEFCHLLGLVNFGTPMVQPHQDEENGKHCNVEDCLMNYRAEAGLLLSGLDGVIPDLDAQCLADLKANGGK